MKKNVRKYDVTLLENIQKGQREENFKGVKVLVKPIPEGGAPGDMDKRIYKSMKMMTTLIKFIPKKKPKEQTPLEKILPIRKMFNGVKSRSIADEGILVSTVFVDSTDNNKAEMRVYKRENAGKNLPVYIYYHGGGYFGGSMDVVEQMCKVLVQNLDCVAFSVNYRLCPEAHYPAPFDDCWSCTKYVYENAGKFGADKNKISVSGDSAGGNMASAITMKDKMEKFNMVKAQILLYPATNMSDKKAKFHYEVDQEKYQVSEKHKKVLQSANSLMSGMLGGEDGTISSMLSDVYLQGFANAEHPYVSPIFGDLSLVPSTLLIFGEHDFLVFDNFAYAKCLTDAKADLKTVVYRGLGHGFADQIGIMPQAEDCMKEIAKFLAEKL